MTIGRSRSGVVLSSNKRNTQTNSHSEATSYFESPKQRINSPSTAARRPLHSLRLRILYDRVLALVELSSKNIRVKRSRSLPLTMSATPRKAKGPYMSAIFVHAGAGYHSIQNERIHLAACNEYDFTSQSHIFQALSHETAFFTSH